LSRVQRAVQEEEVEDPNEERKPHPLCTQPDCLLQEPDVDPNRLAQLVVGTLAGEDLSELTSEGKEIERRDICAGCAVRVMRDGAPYRTEAEHENLVTAANWSHRRQRRRASR
jgi:hypothetical protein